MRYVGKTTAAFIMFSALTFLSPGDVAAEECEGDTCIDVATDRNHEVVITVRKGSSGASTSETSVKKQPTSAASSPLRVRAPAKKKVWIPWLPVASSPQPSRLPRPRPTTSRQARPKTSERVETISASEVMDQVRSLLPGGVIIHQPLSQLLVREPVYFRTSVPQRFKAMVVVLDIPIEIDLRASYLWSFGDGSTLTTSDPGGSYPLSTVRHRYLLADTYEALLRVQWNGTWRSGAMSAPIRGVITQIFTKKIEIQGARTRITQ